MDIWATGCVLSELILSTVDYKTTGITLRSKQLFPADTCYPLSPIGGSKDKESKRDLTDVIMSTLGHQDPEDCSFISSEDTMAYIQSKNTKKVKINFENEYEKTDRHVTTILKGMLEFNPFYRRSAK